MSRPHDALDFSSARGSKACMVGRFQRAPPT
eukprot:CAMPEP_0195134528 /NCGR_PEP_ID=MMETSP0448-20130528/150813_1 /TAXON_ID=66468 /ORGANISM="Heterocapsa triquestra, Strain CCMP 448" /LENGTH=30 /DNA_ID= /DNA_START= /DNA_END= /DNA_ORIENTATION=